MTRTPRADDVLTVDDAADAVARVVTAWNSHSADRLVELSRPDVLWEDPFIPSGRLVGQDALGRWLSGIWRAMPDLCFVVDGPVHLAADGRSLLAEWSGTATMTGPLDPPGFAPTGRPITMTGTDRQWFDGGLLTHVRTTTDVMHVARQIGAAPQPGSFAERLDVPPQPAAAAGMRRRRPAWTGRSPAGPVTVQRRPVAPQQPPRNGGDGDGQAGDRGSEDDQDHGEAAAGDGRGEQASRFRGA